MTRDLPTNAFMRDPSTRPLRRTIVLPPTTSPRASAPTGAKARRRVLTPGTLDVAGALLLGASGAVHLDLYFNGYGPLPTIGALFLLQATGAFALAISVLVSRHAAVSGAGALLALATLGGYLISLDVGLFGFKEVPTTAGEWAGGLELGTFAVLGTATAWGLKPHWHRVAYLVGYPLTLAGALVLALELVIVQPGIGAGLVGAHPTTRTGSRPGAEAISVQAISVPGYGEVLGTRGRYSVYLLSDEGHGRVTCTGGCLSLWPPLLLPSGTTVALAGQGITGRVGTLRLGRSEIQVTYDGYPLYTYAGDPGPDGSAGEGIVSFGGTWYLVRASAPSAAQAPVRAATH